MVVDMVVRHWLTSVESEEVGPDILGRLIQRMESYFYANDDLINSTWNGWPQRAFDILKVFSNWVGLLTKGGNTVNMV